MHYESLHRAELNEFNSITNFSKSFLFAYSFHYLLNYCSIYVLLSYW